MSLVGTSDNHQFLHEIMLVLVYHLITFIVQIFHGSIDDLNATLYDESPSVNLGLCLLHQEQTLSNFRVVGDFHDLHFLNLNSADLASLLK